MITTTTITIPSYTINNAAQTTVFTAFTQDKSLCGPINYYLTDSSGSVITVSYLTFQADRNITVVTTTRTDAGTHQLYIKAVLDGDTT